MIDTSDVVALPKGQAFVLMEGGPLYKVRMPLPERERNKNLPRDLNAMALAMRRDYVTAEHWWSEYDG
jgi:hypothetical protein